MSEHFIKFLQKLVFGIFMYFNKTKLDFVKKSCPSHENKIRINEYKYRISFNKRHTQRLFNFEALSCGTYWRAALKRGRIIEIKELLN